MLYIILLCVLLRETQNFILKFREIFPSRETALRIHRIKSDEKLFYVNFRHFLEKMVHVVMDRYFSLLLVGFEDFS